MVLTKLNENYQISDSLENGWKVQGNMQTTPEGRITISLNFSSVDSDSKEKTVGYYHYNKGELDISGSYNLYAMDNETEFLEICTKLIPEIFAEIEK